MFYIKSILLSGDRVKLEKTIDYFARWHGVQMYGMHNLILRMCLDADDLISVMRHLNSSVSRYVLHTLKSQETNNYVTRDLRSKSIVVRIPVDKQGISDIKLTLTPLSFEDSISVGIEWPCESNYELARLMSFMMFTQKLDDYRVFINGDYQTNYSVKQINAIMSAEIAGFNGIVFIDFIQENQQ